MGDAGAAACGDGEFNDALGALQKSSETARAIFSTYFIIYAAVPLFAPPDPAPATLDPIHASSAVLAAQGKEHLLFLVLLVFNSTAMVAMLLLFGRLKRRVWQLFAIDDGNMADIERVYASS